MTSDQMIRRKKGRSSEQPQGGHVVGTATSSEQPQGEHYRKLRATTEWAWVGHSRELRATTGWAWVGYGRELRATMGWALQGARPVNSAPGVSHRAGRAGLEARSRPMGK